MSIKQDETGRRMELSTVYVSVEDMDRALDFYAELFGTAPTQADDRFSMFAFDGVDFGLYDASHDGGAVEFGDSCVPNFEVDGYRCFHFRDTEGNRIEIFSHDGE